jgi:hypothetical protein
MSHDFTELLTTMQELFAFHTDLILQELKTPLNFLSFEVL